MRLQWLRDRLHNERGSVLLFTFTCSSSCW